MKRNHSYGRGRRMLFGVVALSILAACGGSDPSEPFAARESDDAPAFQQVEDAPPTTEADTTPWTVTDAVVPWRDTPCASLSATTLSPMNAPFNWLAFATQITANEKLERCDRTAPAVGQEWHAISIRSVRQTEGWRLQATVIADGARIAFEGLDLSSEPSTYLLTVPEGTRSLHLEYLVIDQRGLFDLKTNKPLNGHEALYSNPSGRLSSAVASYDYVFDSWTNDPGCATRRGRIDRRIKQVTLDTVLSPFIELDPAGTQWQMASPETAYLKVGMYDGLSNTSLEPASESWFEFTLADGTTVPGRYVTPPPNNHLLEGVVYAEVPVTTREAMLRINLPAGRVSGGAGVANCAELHGQTIEHHIGIG